MPRLERKHSLPTRLFHRANVPILAVMIWSGLLIYWANDVYAIQFRGHVLLNFFPEWFYDRFGLARRLAEGMAWHFAFIWIFALNGVLYVAYTTFSGEWRHLVPNRHTFAETFEVVLHDLDFRRKLAEAQVQRGARLGVEGPAGSKALSLADVKALPRHEYTTELRCIEGWSEVVTWAGARLGELAGSTAVALRGDRPGDWLPYVSLTTPDRKYFVGLDIASAMHPQTLLCYEMNGRPLERSHGAPLRLAIPVKYGIKNLKQIGSIRFTPDRPDDFWAAKGYDWYAGL